MIKLRCKECGKVIYELNEVSVKYDKNSDTEIVCNSCGTLNRFERIDMGFKRKGGI